MRKLYLLTLIVLITAFFLSSCRPPELEGAFVDYKAKRLDNALKLAMEATDKYPDNPEAPYLLGKIYGEKEMFPEMVEAFSKSVQRSPQFEKDMDNQKLYYFQTEYKKAYDNYISYQEIAGDTSVKAMKLLDMAIKHSLNAHVIDPKDYRPLKLTGLAHNYKKEDDQAIHYFTKLTELKPDTVDAWYQLGRVYFNERNFTESVKHNKKAIEIDPSFIPAVELLAFSYESLKDTVNAIKTYQMASQIEPNNVSYLFNLGLIYNKKAANAGDNVDEKNKNYAEAEVLFSKAIELDPDQLDSYQRDLYDSNLQIMYSLKCIAQLQQRKFEECRQTAAQAVERFPDSADLYEYLAIAYANLGDTVKAKEAQEKAKQLKE